MIKNLKIKIVYNVFDYLHKEFDEEELLNRLNKLLELKVNDKEKIIIKDLILKIDYECKNNFQNSNEDENDNNNKIKKYNSFLKKGITSKKTKEILEQMINDINNEKTTLSRNISKLLMSCPIYIKCAKSMSNKEIMELITRYIGGPMPNINNETLNVIIDEAIKTGIPEKGWRIAFNYDDMLIDKSKIEDFIVSSGSGYHIAEMSNAGFIGIHIDKLVEAIINTKDIKEMSYFIISSRSDVLTLKNKQKIEQAIKDLDGWKAYQDYIENPHFSSK